MNVNCVIHTELQQGSDRWFEVRKGKCSSSESKSLYAAKKGFETYMIQKEAELHLQVIEPGASSFAMDRGKELEPIARDLFIQEKLLDVVEVGFVERPDLNAGWSPDGLVMSGEVDIISGIEIKCRNAVNHYRVFKEGIDMPTYQQMQFAMAITDIPMMYFVAYNPDFDPEFQLYIQEVPVSNDLAMQTILLLKKVKQEIGL